MTLRSDKCGRAAERPKQNNGRELQVQNKEDFDISQEETGFPLLK